VGYRRRRRRRKKKGGRVVLVKNEKVEEHLVGPSQKENTRPLDAVA